MKRVSLFLLGFLIVFLIFFLPNVAYAPGFGTTDVGSSTQGFGDYLWGASDDAGTIFSPSDDGTVDNITAYMDSVAGLRTVALAIYNETYYIVGYTEEISITTTAQWYTADIVSGGSVEGGERYYLAGWSGAAQSRYYFDLDSSYTSRAVSDSYDYPNWESPAGWGTDSNRKISIYCNYTITPAGTTYTENPTINLTFSLDTAQVFFRTFIQSPTVNLVFTLASSIQHITALWKVNPVVNLTFTLASLQEIYRRFFQYSTVNLVFSLSSSLTPYLSFLVNPSVNLLYSLVSTVTEVAAALNVNPSILINFGLSTITTPYLTHVRNHVVNLIFTLASSTQLITGAFNVNPSIPIIFSLSSIQTFYRYFLENPNINVMFNLASSTVLIGPIWNVNPNIIINFALSSMQTPYLFFNVAPSIVINYALSSIQTYITGLHQVSAAINMIFNLAFSVSIVVPTTIDDVLGLAAIALILAIVALALVVIKRD